MKLYKLHKEMVDIENALEVYAQEHEGDITDFPFKSHYELLGSELESRLLNLGAWHKNMIADVKAHAEEIKSQQHKKKVAENKAKWIKNFILAYIKPGSKLKDSRVALGWRKSKAIEFDVGFDVEDLPDKYINIVKTANKTALKEAIENGITVEDVTLEEKNNLQIK